MQTCDLSSSQLLRLIFLFLFTEFQKPWVLQLFSRGHNFPTSLFVCFSSPSCSELLWDPESWSGERTGRADTQGCVSLGEVTSSPSPGSFLIFLSVLWLPPGEQNKQMCQNKQPKWQKNHIPMWWEWPNTRVWLWQNYPSTQHNHRLLHRGLVGLNCPKRVVFPL